MGVKQAKKVQKPGKSGKASKNGTSARKTPTLKQKNARVNKIIKLDQLQWKPVDIPDNLGDYSGFFGLEELEGVDVVMLNGKPEFIMKDSDDEDDEDMEGSDADDEVEEEFTGFDDEKEDSSGKKGKKDLKSNNSGKKEQKEQKKLEKKSEKKSEEKSEEKSKGSEPKPDQHANENDEDDDELMQNAFAALNMPLPDDNDINLPEWKAIDLSPYTLSGLQALEFNKPTPIQTETIPLAISGKDVIGKATTGSGKTLAYGIPILEKYISKLEEIKESRTNETIPAPSGIVFAPTRELAHQVVDHLNKIAKYSPLSNFGIVSVTGGLSIQRQERLLLYGPGIVVATPGRFLELIERDADLAKRMASTDIVVLDEADRLLQDGHFEEFEKILEVFEKSRNKATGWRWQTLVFSATFSRELFGKLDKKGKMSQQKQTGLIGNDEILQLLSKKLKFKDPKPALVDANPKEIVSGQITEALVECGPTERDLYLYYFVLMYPGSTLVFANSVESVRRLVPLLDNLGIPAFSIHSSMMQKQRLRALERFKEASANNKSAVLVASDVAARGLDIPNIDHVAHYHLPRSADIYIHRSGRTARAGKEGVSVMFCSPQEASGPLKKLRRLMSASAENTRLNMKADVKLLPIDNDIVSQLRNRVVLASKLGDSSISNTATRKEDSWLKQAADDLGIEVSDLEDFEDDVIKKQRRRKEKKLLTKDEQQSLRYELKQLLAVPLRKNHRRSYLTSGLENLAHQIVTGVTSKTVLGRKEVKALDELRSKKKVKGGDNKVKSGANKVTKNSKKPTKKK